MCWSGTQNELEGGKIEHVAEVDDRRFTVEACSIQVDILFPLHYSWVYRTLDRSYVGHDDGTNRNVSTTLNMVVQVGSGSGGCTTERARDLNEIKSRRVVAQPIPNMKVHVSLHSELTTKGDKGVVFF